MTVGAELVWLNTRRAKILVVDDDPCIRELMRLHLSSAGYRVQEAEDAIVAGRKLLEHLPDLIILDVDLPYMDGIEFAATLTADVTIPFVPIVLVTEHEHHQPKAEALCADLLVKPFVKDRLFQVVARTLERYARRPAFSPKRSLQVRRIPRA